MSEHYHQHTASCPLDTFLDRCPDAKSSGNEGWYVARCPGHDDTHASLSFREDEHGGIVLKCHAGCTRETILQGASLKEKDMHPRGEYRPIYRIRSKLELIDLAADKLLPWQFLFSLGIQDEYDWHGTKVVQIPYFTREGEPHTKMRVRTDVTGKKGSCWDEDTPGEIIPYGLHKLDMAERQRYLLIGEGESDAWTCWYHDVPYLGVPGATNERCLRGKDLQSVPRIYIIQEPDKAGQGFYKRVHKQLRTTGYKGEIYALLFKKLTGCKDPNALHQQQKGQNFKEVMQQAREKAIPSGDEIDHAKAPKPATYRLCDLQKEQLPDLKWAIPDILPEGLTWLCGKAKLGKSWLLLSMMTAISAGGVVMGNVPVEQGEVLYLALEDNKRRLKNRANTLLKNFPASPNFHYATSWPRMNQGGLEALEEWILEHPRVRLIGIDVWAKFKPLQRSSTQKQQQYDEDYDTITPLQELASKHNISIILVHHMRKQESDDPLDMISGSTGLQGAVDGFLILYRKRGESDARLFITGRDVEKEQELLLSFDQDCATWTIKGDANEATIATTPERQRIVDTLKDGPLTGRELAQRLSKNEHTIRNHLVILRNEGKVLLQNNAYRLVETSNGSRASKTGSGDDQPREATSLHVIPTSPTSTILAKTSRTSNTTNEPVKANDDTPERETTSPTSRTSHKTMKQEVGQTLYRRLSEVEALKREKQIRWQSAERTPQDYTHYMQALVTMMEDESIIDDALAEIRHKLAYYTTQS